MFNVFFIPQKMMGKTKYQILFLAILFFFGLLSAEKVCKFEYAGIPEHLNGKTLVLPEEFVAMSEFALVDMFEDSMAEREKNSIIFIIDNSGSMKTGGSGSSPSDQWGSRFTVTSDLIDSIYAIDSHIQVGLVIFGSHLYFDPNDDPLFSECPEYKTGSYIPLLTLDSIYNGKTGYDILKFYLQTDTSGSGSQRYVDLKYKPSNTDLSVGATNITAGFEAAKHGMELSKFFPERRFLIFLSDGDATYPNDDATKYKFVKGEGVPTTFTVYFTSQNTVPPRLDTMTTNIQNNGYSSTNPLSNLWSIETEYDKLMKLLMQNVIGKMVNKGNYLVPANIKINNISPPNGWDSTGFTFSDLFELKGQFTDFDYEIEYGFYEDSIFFNDVTNTYDTVYNFLKDSVHTANFTVEIQNGASIPNLVNSVCWGRNLDFYYKGSKINLVNETMDSIEVRFEEYFVEMVYGYEDVQVVLTHGEGTSQDIETFDLEDQGSHLSYKFKRVVDNPNPNDNVLQHQSPDNIIAIFRNPKLCLDTLRDTIPYRLSTVVEVHKGIYFDNDADGYIDSIYIGIYGDKIDKNIDEIIDNIIFPPYRNFTLIDYEVSGDGISVIVEEDHSNYMPKTYVTSEDILIVQDTVILKEGGMLLPSTIEIIDSLAPVINKASLVDSLKISGRDELTIKFSEPVQTIKDSIPFVFYSLKPKKKYKAVLSVMSQDKEKCIFEVIRIDGGSSVTSIDDGDSVNINWDIGLNVYDELLNNQDNSKNIRREIDVTVIKAILKVTHGIYFDTNADGFVDSMFIGVEGENVDENAKDILLAIKLPSFRDFKTKNSKKYIVKGGMTFTVEEKASHPTTYCTKDDVLKIKDYVLPNGGVVGKGKVPIYDSIAPIIHWDDSSAFLVDYQDSSITDTLTIKLSEEINKVKHRTPFKFIDMRSGDNKKYTVKLKQIDLKGNIIKFKVKGILSDDVMYMQTGDSIWINDSNCIKDFKKNYQDNPLNIKRELIVQRKLIKIDLIPNTITPFKIKQQGNLVIKKEIIISLDSLNQIELENSIDNTSNKFKGIIITVSPVNPDILLPDYELDGRISIFDPVGNTILFNRQMGFFDKTKSLIFFWHGKNLHDRFVGASSYLAEIKTKEVTPSLYKNGGGPEERKHIYIGVSE